MIAAVLDYNHSYVMPSPDHMYVTSSHSTLSHQATHTHMILHSFFWESYLTEKILFSPDSTIEMQIPCGFCTVIKNFFVWLQGPPVECCNDLKDFINKSLAKGTVC